MPKSMEEVHNAGQHASYPRKRCPLCNPPQGDFRVENHGSLMLVYPVSEAADDWISEHVPEATFHGDALVVEPRYIHSLVIGMEDAGLVRI